MVANCDVIAQFGSHMASPTGAIRATVPGIEAGEEAQTPC